MASHEEGATRLRGDGLSFSTRVQQYSYSTTPTQQMKNEDTSYLISPLKTPKMQKTKGSPLSMTKTRKNNDGSRRSVTVQAHSANGTLPTPRSRKRKNVDSGDESGHSTPTAKKRRSTAKERSMYDPQYPVNNLVDSLQPGLSLVFVGLNPGLNTAKTGHAYSHPSNLFWKFLHLSGITPVKHLPSETNDLMALYSIGNTNLCQRPSRSANDLTTQEQLDGVAIVDQKIKKFKPDAVCVVGKGIWEFMWRAKTGKKLKIEQFRYGWQDEEMWAGRQVDETGKIIWAGARTYVTTTTSGLAAYMKPSEKLAVWKPLGDWVKARRDEEEA